LIWFFENFIFLIPTEILRIPHLRKFRYRIDRKINLHVFQFIYSINFLFLKEQNPCESSPCQHHSVCITKPNHNIQCICRPHYAGKFCEYPGRYNSSIYSFILNQNILVPFHFPTYNQKCNRICRNGGICFVNRIKWWQKQTCISKFLI